MRTLERSKKSFECPRPFRACHIGRDNALTVNISDIRRTRPAAFTPHAAPHFENPAFHNGPFRVATNFATVPQIRALPSICFPKP